MDWRTTSLKAICWGEFFRAVAMGIADRTRLRVARHPLEGLHPPHGPPDHTQKLIDAQKIDQMPLGLHHIADSDHREIETVGLPRLRMNGRRTRAALAAADDIGTDDEVQIRIEGLTRTDHGIPPADVLAAPVMAGRMGVGGQGMEDEDGVRSVLVQMSIGFVGQGHGSQGLPRFQEKLARWLRESKVLCFHNPDGVTFFCHMSPPYRTPGMV